MNILLKFKYSVKKIRMNDSSPKIKSNLSRKLVPFLRFNFGKKFPFVFLIKIFDRMIIIFHRMNTSWNESRVRA
ncbi:hypothetical protein LEP1GSC071_1444 [Leptospira santarosai str. JET]|nr:hypothetical protein LEP1GSC071_1444 [Leptospira santarosai str. JET]